MRAEGVVESCEGEAHAHGHGLPVVKAGVRGPVGVADVGFVEVGEEGPKGLGEGGEGEESATEHAG